MLTADGNFRVWRRPTKPCTQVVNKALCKLVVVPKGEGDLNVAWAGPSGQTGPIVDWKWLCSATWRSFAAIHGLHVSKQQ
ncbi:hypothetical protein AVEN_172542-1 [Araneus ventricosus]|uniref:Uncharacterized protein n=1 Tax=Araneus ventricosus TaxID=182803 RepID=A0A4Y2PU74_ARAVE|nr:hypothetical protein AVEN_12241-1 [Araneus ventricosus]GBN54730.1 hypothetical protein AVEN_62296-1 [Araneus ventricosus]GBN54781.1 hypothetical protein AVEN_144091-1 [Araneus ventricosus]GBN54810.1 hypothetical protein AVEN_172542-1 [Araneus ventricosus]